MASQFPWKSNFQKVPSSIENTLKAISSDLIAVAATKTVKKQDIEAGLYAHVGLVAKDGALSGGDSIMPPPTSGKWSARNAFGWDRKRPDLPKVYKTYTFESPNFGDGPRNGWTMRSWTKEVYQHQIFEPQGMTIASEILGQNGASGVLVKFTVSPMLSRSSDIFDTMLLWAINVLQENVGAVNVFASDASHADYVATLSLDWQVFPPGTIEEVVSRLTAAKGASNVPDYEQHVRERVRLFQTYKPVAYLKGQGGFGSYFGAQFADDLVVFENLRYGNAVYLLYDNWTEASKRSRLDLLRDRDANFDRVEHNRGWERRLQALLHDRLHQRGLRPKRKG